MIPCMIPKKYGFFGYFKVFIAIKPFQNYHSSDVFGAKPPLILKLIPLVIKSDTDTILILLKMVFLILILY